MYATSHRTGIDPTGPHILQVVIMDSLSLAFYKSVNCCGENYREKLNICTTGCTKFKVTVVLLDYIVLFSYCPLANALRPAVSSRLRHSKHLMYGKPMALSFHCL